MRLRLVPAVLCFASVLAGTSVMTTGCGAGCDRTPSGPPVMYAGGTTDTVHQSYESAPVEGPYLDFPGGRTYRFYHGLGGEPQNVVPWFSFDEYPYAPPHGSGAVIAAGNQATIQAVTSTYIDIRNDSCSDVRLRVYADHPTVASTADGGP